MAVSKTETAKTEKQVKLVLTGRKTQYIAGKGILRRGKPFPVSEEHSKKLLAAKNRATGEFLFMTETAYKEELEREQYAAANSDDSLDLGLVEKGVPKGGHAEIEEV